MQTFLKLGKMLKLDKVELTYHSLIRMSLYILGSFMALSIIVGRFFSTDSALHFNTLAETDYESAEKEFVVKLTADPSNAKLWRMFVDARHKALFQSLTASGSYVGITRNRRKAVTFHLSNTDFDTFLGTAVKPSATVLRFRQKILASGFSGPIPDNLSVDKSEELGRLYYDKKEYKKAIVLFYMVLEQTPSNSEIRILALKSTQRSNPEEFLNLLEKDEWRPFFNDRLLYNYYLQKGQYHWMFYHLTKDTLSSYSLQSVILSLIGGFCWVIFLVHLGGGWSWSGKEKFYILLAFVLGMISANVCLGVIVVQEHLLDLKDYSSTASIGYNLAYCILGIGLREELCKLLLFLPLLPFLSRLRENYKILIYCSLVGLGFAVEENMLYLTSSGSIQLMGRFLTANFIHMLLTGYICYHLVLAVKNKGRAWDGFTTALVKMIVIHGVYDFFLIDPTMASGGYSFFSMMIFVYMSMQYLSLMMTSSPPRHRYVSLTRVFTIVLCVTVGAVLFTLGVEVGLKVAIKVIFAGMLTNGIFAYMFFREFNDEVR